MSLTFFGSFDISLGFIYAIKMSPTLFVSFNIGLGFLYAIKMSSTFFVSFDIGLGFIYAIKMSPTFFVSFDIGRGPVVQSINSLSKMLIKNLLCLLVQIKSSELILFASKSVEILQSFSLF